MLAVFGGYWGLLFGVIMNIWFWPYATGAAALYWQPGIGVVETVQRYLAFYAVTSLVWDLMRLVGNVLLIALAGGRAARAAPLPAPAGLQLRGGGRMNEAPDDERDEEAADSTPAMTHASCSAPPGRLVDLGIGGHGRADDDAQSLLPGDDAGLHRRGAGDRGRTTPTESVGQALALPCALWAGGGALLGVVQRADGPRGRRTCSFRCRIGCRCSGGR